MIDFLMVLYWLAGVVVVGGATLAFLFHSAGVVWWMTKGKK